MTVSTSLRDPEVRDAIHALLALDCLDDLGSNVPGALRLLQAATLVGGRPVTVRALAEEMGIPTSAAGRAMQALVKAGLARKSHGRGFVTTTTAPMNGHRRTSRLSAPTPELVRCRCARPLPVADDDGGSCMQCGRTVMTAHLERAA